MKRILIFCVRDWLNPKAGAVEHYTHEVFRRVAGEGNYVAWVAHNYAVSPFSKTRPPRMEIVDGIQIARLGIRPLYRTVVRLLLSRLARAAKISTRFDVFVDCVDGYPLPLAQLSGDADVPVLPLVFHLARKVRVSADPPGPVVAASREAREELHRAGMPDSAVVHAPWGVDSDVFVPGDERSPSPTLAILRERSHMLLGAVASLRRAGKCLSVEAADGLSEASRAGLYGKAWLGYCGEGRESEALALGACGVPVVCADTAAARDFVVDGETGLLFEGGSGRGLADCLARLLDDEVLRKRLGNGGRERALTRSWDETSDLVLATIEDLCGLQGSRVGE